MSNPNSSKTVSDAHHTPGPWAIVSEGRFGLWVIDPRNPDSTAVCQVIRHAKPECEANANLIVAAPDLLVEARILRCLASNPRFQGMTVAAALAELKANDCGHDDGAAIDKAEGAQRIDAKVERIDQLDKDLRGHPDHDPRGERIAPQPCSSFLAFENAPGYCQCGWMRHEHGLGSVAQTVEAEYQRLIAMDDHGQDCTNRAPGVSPLKLASLLAAVLAVFTAGPAPARIRCDQPLLVLGQGVYARAIDADARGRLIDVTG